MSPCYHKMCKSCIRKQFMHGSSPCCVCKTLLKKTDFFLCTFDEDDVEVERECRIRAKVLRYLSRDRDEFADLHAWNDHLEHIENVIFELVENPSIEDTNDKLETLRRESNYKKEEKSALNTDEDEKRVDKLQLQLNNLRHQAQQQSEKQLDIIKQLTNTTATGEKKTKRRKIRSSAVAKESIIDPLEGISKPIAYSHTGTDIYSRSKIDQRWYHLRAVSSISSSLFLKYA